MSLKSVWILAVVFLCACGVKAPPLPPLPVTPEQADRQMDPRPTPSNQPQHP